MWVFSLGEVLSLFQQVLSGLYVCVMYLYLSLYLYLESDSANRWKYALIDENVVDEIVLDEIIQKSTYKCKKRGLRTGS